MTCSVSNSLPPVFCPRAIVSAAAIALTVFVVPAGATHTKTWVADTLHVEATDYRWGQLISLKGAVENGDPFRATRIMVEAGQRPDPRVWEPALRELTAPTTYLGV